MIEKKNIDRLFQEEFKDFEAIPAEKVWENIEAELREKKKRRVIPFWFRFAGAAAILLLGALLFRMALSDDKPNKIVHGDKPSHLIPENSTLPNAVIANTSDENSSDGNTSDGNSIGDNQTNKNSSGRTVSNEKPSIENQHQSAHRDLQNRLNENKNAVVSSGSDANQNSNFNPVNTVENQRNIHRRQSGNNIKSTTAVAQSDSSIQKNHRHKATNRNNTHLENAAADKTGNAIAQSSQKHKKADDGKAATASDPAHESIAVADKNSKNSSSDIMNPTENKTAQTDKTPRQNVQKNTDITDLKSTQNNTGIADSGTKKDTAAIATAVPNALEELLNEKENNVTAKEQKVNRWQITSNVAPIYFSSTSNGSPLDSRFESNKKTYAPSVSYGMGAKYAINKKFFIKSGVNSVALEYNTSDVIFFQTENARRIQNVSPNIQGSLIQVDNKPSGQVSTLGRTIRQFSGDLNQQINYIEIPMEMTYKVFDRKFGVELVGGLSTLILNRNEVSLVSSGINMNIGEADNLNDLHFSTNLGVGFKYSFLRHFEANFEPMFKYQINTFTSDSGNFKPYFFGLYSGVSYRF